MIHRCAGLNRESVTKRCQRLEIIHSRPKQHCSEMRILNRLPMCVLDHQSNPIEKHSDHSHRDCFSSLLSELSNSGLFERVTFGCCGSVPYVSAASSLILGISAIWISVSFPHARTAVLLCGIHRKVSQHRHIVGQLQPDSDLLGALAYLVELRVRNYGVAYPSH